MHRVKSVGANSAFVAVVDTDRVVASVARRVGGNSAFLADIDTNAASWCQ